MPLACRVRTHSSWPRLDQRAPSGEREVATWHPHVCARESKALLWCTREPRHRVGAVGSSNGVTTRAIGRVQLRGGDDASDEVVVNVVPLEQESIRQGLVVVEQGAWPTRFLKHVFVARLGDVHGVVVAHGHFIERQPIADAKGSAKVVRLNAAEAASECIAWPKPWASLQAVKAGPEIIARNPDVRAIVENQLAAMSSMW